MITSLNIKNFKSHENTILDLGNLTILSGQNGVGKSSIIQSLLLLRQTYQKGRLNVGLDLNKPLCSIGTAQDALYEFAEDLALEVEMIIDESDRLHWRFSFDFANTKSTFMELNSFTGKEQSLKELHLFNTDFQYLSAARLAPRESYPRDDYEIKQNKQLSIEKGQGELVAHFLDYYGNKNIEFSSCKHPNEEDLALLAQTTAWETEVSKDIDVKVIEVGNSYELRYGFNGDKKTNDYKAENVGFGVTYTLPLIVAILSAKEDSLLLIENPEAHLHPYGQSKLAELICLAAQAGVQIVVETHSDHIINGILVASKKFELEDVGIHRENVKFYHFIRNEQRHSTHAVEIKIEKGGKIDRQPDGFFDQMQSDLEKIMGF